MGMLQREEHFGVPTLRTDLAQIVQDRVSDLAHQGISLDSSAASIVERVPFRVPNRDLPGEAVALRRCEIHIPPGAVESHDHAPVPAVAQYCSCTISSHWSTLSEPTGFYEPTWAGGHSPRYSLVVTTLCEEGQSLVPVSAAQARQPAYDSTHHRHSSFTRRR